MPSLTQTRDAAIALLRTSLPTAQRVEAFAGDIDLAALAQKGVPPGGSLYVAALSAVNVGQGLDFDMQASLGCFCLARAPKAEVREAEALALAESAAKALHGATFGLATVTPARVVAISSVPDEDVEQSGVVVWAVLWEQSLLF